MTPPGHNIHSNTKWIIQHVWKGYIAMYWANVKTGLRCRKYISCSEILHRLNVKHMIPISISDDLRTIILRHSVTKSLGLSTKEQVVSLDLSDTVHYLSHNPRPESLYVKVSRDVGNEPVTGVK